MCIHACLLPHSLGITIHRVHGLFHCRMCVRLIVQQIDKLLHMQYICMYIIFLPFLEIARPVFLDMGYTLGCHQN